MFDIAFSEMLLIAVVALVVIGPERLPKVARTLGHLFGRMQRYVAQVKSDINREIAASELSSVKTEFESAARTFQQDVETHARQAEEEIRQVEREIDQQVNPSAPAAGPAEPDPGKPSDGPAPESASPSASDAAASPQLELGIGEPAGPVPDKAKTAQ